MKISDRARIIIICRNNIPKLIDNRPYPLLCCYPMISFSCSLYFAPYFLNKNGFRWLWAPLQNTNPSLILYQGEIRENIHIERVYYPDYSWVFEGDTKCTRGRMQFEVFVEKHTYIENYTKENPCSFSWTKVEVLYISLHSFTDNINKWFRFLCLCNLNVLHIHPLPGTCASLTPLKLKYLYNCH